MIKIATDSTCDLPAEYFEEYDITTVPINIQFGTETYEDGVTIDREAFYRKVEELGILPTTSQPSAISRSTQTTGPLPRCTPSWFRAPQVWTIGSPYPSMNFWNSGRNVCFRFFQ